MKAIAKMLTLEYSVSLKTEDGKTLHKCVLNCIKLKPTGNNRQVDVKYSNEYESNDGRGSRSYDYTKTVTENEYILDIEATTNALNEPDMLEWLGVDSVEFILQIPEKTIWQ